jgi:nucleotide-binding universal stress UspA family protein
MTYNKLFFPIGGGEELRDRIHGALLISKYFNSHLEIFKSEAKPSQIMKIDESLPPSVLKELNAMVKDRLEEDLVIHETLFKEEASLLGVEFSKKRIKDTATAEVVTGSGYRSKLVEQESKYCDLVVVASPPGGKLTATFETTVTKSGNPAIMFPRKMQKFSTDKVVIGWNNSPESARAISLAIPIMQKAKHVHIVTSKEYLTDSDQIGKLQSYLACNDIETTFEIVKTTMIPGQALLNKAKEGNFDLIVAGAFGHKGFKEIMFGGTTKYVLEHTDIPVFMSN